MNLRHSIRRSRAEAKILMRVQEHILTPRYGGAVIGGIRPSLLHTTASGNFSFKAHSLKCLEASLTLAIFLRLSKMRTVTMPSVDKI